MKKALFLIIALVIVATIAYAIDPYSDREVRDPTKLRARLDADFATVAAGVGVSAVTNATAATAVTVQTGTITVTIVPQTIVLTNIVGDVTNVWSVCTNVTASFTGVTNATAATTLTLQKN
jgi:hypothetical protein